MEQGWGIIYFFWVPGRGFGKNVMIFGLYIIFKYFILGEGQLPK